MAEIAVRVEGLGKRFAIGATAPLRRLARLVGRPAPERKAFWALRDVSFDVERGEALGIIGPNGAGKSTLLKILSRITEPTTGSAELAGRVSSLLEVGTGFHPELTGRENTYLNGAILGMKRAEIRARFDEIVDFSGVEKFIDTPVKRFSSGMRVRLAFAVAAHLQPEILIVDEVLAVGDARFQEKCLGRMRKVAGEGRTVLFVSHNMAAVEGLCSRAVRLEDGRIRSRGDATEVVRDYLSEIVEGGGSSYHCTEAPDARAWIEEALLCDDEGRELGQFGMSEPVRLRLRLRVAEASHYTMSVQIKEADGNPVAHFPSDDAACEIPGKPGVYRVDVEIPPLQLYPGRYLVRLAVTDGVVQTQRELQRLAYAVVQDPALCQRPLVRRAGLIFGRAHWRTQRVEQES
jgi:lipopolysaccharide transport system ATP-binding protein